MEIFNSCLFHNLVLFQSENSIKIKNANLVCPQFYFAWHNGKPILTANHKLKEKGKRVFLPTIDIKHSMWGIDGKYMKMLNAPQPELPYKVINNYSEITLTSWGELEVKPNDYSRLYSVPIEDAFPLIRQWEEKYMDTVSDLCRKGEFIPTLTGGCDTRILTHFWRTHNLKCYRLRAVKKDGKNNVEKGLKEIEISQKVIARLGMELERKEEPPDGMCSMSGAYTEATQYPELLNNRNFITDVVNRCDFEWEQLQPFVDDLYLMIKPDELLEMRVLFMLLFCPDLLDIEFISDYKGSVFDSVYSFRDFGEVIERCQRLIARWK